MDAAATRRVNIAFQCFLDHLEAERSSSSGGDERSDSEVASLDLARASKSRSRSPLPRFRHSGCSQRELVTMMEQKISEVRGDFLQQLNLFRQEMVAQFKEFCAQSKAEVHDSKGNLQDPPDEAPMSLCVSATGVSQGVKTSLGMDLSKARVADKDKLKEIFAAWETRLKNCRGDLRTSLSVLFQGVGTAEELHSIVTAMGVHVLTVEDQGQVHSAPFAHVAGDRAQPALQVVWKLLPEQRMTIQLNPKKNTVTVKAKRAAIQANICPLLCFFGPVLDVSSSVGSKVNQQPTTFKGSHAKSGIEAFLGWK